VDRRAKKLEKKRKSREEAKKNARTRALQKTQQLALLVRSAGGAEFGPCYVSAGWDALTPPPALVTVLVTRKLSTGHFVPAIVLVDRTCLGVKNGYSLAPMGKDELADLVDEVGSAHGGMSPCSPLVAQSIVFHAIDYARSLGFEPHRDFPARLFGDRTAELLDTPWHAPERPFYINGPHDDSRAILRRLQSAVGDGGFDRVQLSRRELGDDELEDDDLEDDADSEMIVRRASDAGWILEIEDHLGGSRVG